MTILALTNPTYKPAMRIISTISNAVNPSVTTTFAHGYLSGTIVRLFIPEGFGMVQANNLEGTITVTGPTTFTIDIDSIPFDPFTVPVVFPLDLQAAQVVPTGEVNRQLSAASYNVLS